MRYKQEYTLLPTQLLFKVDRVTEYERDELLKKWKLDKLLQERKSTDVEEEKNPELLLSVGRDRASFKEKPSAPTRYSFMRKRPDVSAAEKNQSTDIAQIQPMQSN